MKSFYETRNSTVLDKYPHNFGYKVEANTTKYHLVRHKRN